MRRQLRVVVAALLLALLAGCAVSVGVAWGASLLSNAPPAAAGPQAYLGPVPGSPSWSWFVNEHRGPAHVAYIFRKASMRPPFPAAHRAMPHREPGTLARWAPVPGAGMKVDVHGFGWPWACLWGSRSDSGGASTFLTLRGRAGSTRELRVPVRPIVWGLVADTVVWGGVGWGDRGCGVRGGGDAGAVAAREGAVCWVRV